jgi:hypothetical protein
MLLKKCSTCSAIMQLKKRGDRRESPTEYQRRRFCSLECRKEGTLTKSTEEKPMLVSEEDRLLIKTYDDHIRATAKPGRQYWWSHDRRM